MLLLTELIIVSSVILSVVVPSPTVLLMATKSPVFFGSK
jgi:hypothetical protein